MTGQSRWRAVTVVSGIIVAGLLMIAVDLDFAWAVMVVGAWVLAGAALRVLVDYRRAGRERSRD